jgi:hypothetical protein
MDPLESYDPFDLAGALAEGGAACADYATPAEDARTSDLPLQKESTFSIVTFRVGRPAPIGTPMYYYLTSYKNRPAVACVPHNDFETQKKLISNYRAMRIMPIVESMRMLHEAILDSEAVEKIRKACEAEMSR